MELMRELYGAPDATTISVWTEELNRPHASDNTLVKTMSRQRHLHTKLADAGQPMSEFEKIKLFEKSVENYAGALKLVRMYKEREPLVRDQLFLDLMTLVILHEPSLTTGAMGFSASAAISRSEVEALIARSVEDAYARGLAAGARGSGPGRSGGRGGRGIWSAVELSHELHKLVGRDVTSTYSWFADDINVIWSNAFEAKLTNLFCKSNFISIFFVLDIVPGPHICSGVEWKWRWLDTSGWNRR